MSSSSSHPSPYHRHQHQPLYQAQYQSSSPQSLYTPVSSSPPDSVAQFICLYPSCVHHPGFSRHADLERHVKIVHNRPTLELVDCAYAGVCHRKGQYGFTRKDKMIEHMRDVHKCNIPKRGNERRES